LAEPAADRARAAHALHRVATPTEIGAVGAALAAIIGAVFGRLTLPKASMR